MHIHLHAGFLVIQKGSKQVLEYRNSGAYSAETGAAAWWWLRCHSVAVFWWTSVAKRRGNRMTIHSACYGLLRHPDDKAGSRQQTGSRQPLVYSLTLPGEVWHRAHSLVQPPRYSRRLQIKIDWRNMPERAGGRYEGNWRPLIRNEANQHGWIKHVWIRSLVAAAGITEPCPYIQVHICSCSSVSVQQNPVEIK